jgi:hypothetical protein
MIETHRIEYKIECQIINYGEKDEDIKSKFSTKR